MEQGPAIEGNLWRFQAFAAVVFTPFMLPVLVLFWQDNGLDLFDVFALQGLFAVAVVLLEVPTGMIADRLGKRTSLSIAAVVLAISMLGYALGHGFSAFLAAEIGLALGVALYSGADAALLFDTLEALDRKAEYQRLSGRIRAIQMISIALANIAGGIVGSWSLRATLWMSILGPVLAFVVARGFVEVQKPEVAETPRAALKAYGALIASATKFVRKHRLVQWQIALMAVLVGSATWLLWLYQPYMQMVGLPIWAFGVAFAIFNGWAALLSTLAHRFDGWFGELGTVVVLMVLQILPLIGMALWIHPASWLLILGHQSVRGVVRTVISERILRHTYADKRSTVLSMASLAARFFFAATAPVIGLASRALTLPEALLIQAALLTVVFGGLLISYGRIDPKYFRIKKQDSE